MSTPESRLATRLLGLGLLIGAVPLGLQALLFVRLQSTTDSSFDATETIVATLVAVLVLLACTLFLSGRLWRSLERSLGSIRRAVTEVAGSDFRARAEVDGPGCELDTLGQELNGLLESRQQEILNLRIEAERAESLRESSRQLIEECIYAREPLAKQHPGLAAAYATAAIRQAGNQTDDPNKTVHGLVEGVDGAGHSRGNRVNLRWTPKDVRIEVPMPSKLLNMSVSGMAVESDRGLPVGGSWIFRVGTEALAYDIPGRICWCRLERTVKIDDEIRPVYRTGVEFEDQLSGKAFDFFGPAALDTGSAKPAPW